MSSWGQFSLVSIYKGFPLGLNHGNIEIKKTKMSQRIVRLVTWNLDACSPERLGYQGG